MPQHTQRRADDLTPPPAPDDPRPAPLRMESEEFRRAGYALVDAVAGFLASVPARPVTPGAPPAVVRAALDADAPLPDEGRDAGELLQEAATLLFEHSLLNGHPRFFGYITSSPAHIGMLGDLLAAAVNPNVGSWRLGPLATELEAQTVRWIAELIGYPPGGSGLLVSGGNMANLVAFLAARAAAGGPALRAHGLAAHGGPTLRAYASTETHTWIQKAADIAGLGTENIRWIPTDAELRLDTGALREAIARDVAAGDRPMLVVGTSGTVAAP